MLHSRVQSRPSGESHFISRVSRSRNCAMASTASTPLPLLSILNRRSRWIMQQYWSAQMRAPLRYAMAAIGALGSMRWTNWRNPYLKRSRAKTGYDLFFDFFSKLLKMDVTGRTSTPACSGDGLTAPWPAGGTCLYIHKYWKTFTHCERLPYISGHFDGDVLTHVEI